MACFVLSVFVSNVQVKYKMDFLTKISQKKLKQTKNFPKNISRKNIFLKQRSYLTEKKNFLKNKNSSKKICLNKKFIFKKLVKKILHKKFSEKKIFSNKKFS